MHTALLWSAVAFYGLGTVLVLSSLRRSRLRLSPWSLGALGLGLLLHAAALAITTLQTHRLPLTDVHSAVSFFAFSVTTAFFLVYLRYPITSLGIFMLPFVFVLSLISALRPPQSFSSAGFSGGWFFVHIASMMLGYTGLFLTSVGAIMYLLQESELKSKKPRALYYRLPSLEVCDELYYRSLVFGLIFLSLGILTGVVWASRTWHGPWQLDPKIVASLVTWIIYLVLFSTRLSGAGHRRRAAYVAIFGFAAVMVTFLGISFLSSQHGFFPKLGGNP
jgi:ABC-type transport system involved in cytochrome c biogenesis permease subunit